MIDSLRDKNFYILWLASILGAVSVLPYTIAQSRIVMTPSLVVGVLIQSAFLYAFIVFFGIRISKKLDFKIIPSNKFIVPSIVSGLAVGLTLKLLDQFIFKNHANIFLTAIPNVDLLYRVLASFYGAINEEVLLRLFAVSLVVLFLQKFTKLSKKIAIILSIVFCALLFAAGHLSMLYKIATAPNTYDIIRVMMLNGLAGIAFGLLYWRYGLIASMLSHFIADLVIHVFWIF